MGHLDGISAAKSVLSFYARVMNVTFPTMRSRDTRQLDRSTDWRSVPRRSASVMY